MHRRRRTFAQAALVVAAAALAAGGGLAGAFFVHRPWAIPSALRAPASLSPTAEQGGLRVRSLGVTGYEITDGATTLIFDPAVTRPGPLELISGPLVPDDALAARWMPRADFIIVNHAHHDHAIDMPSLALRTGATVLGTQSTANLARARGVPPERIVVVQGGERLRLGTLDVELRTHEHVGVLSLPNPMSGVIDADAGPLWFHQYRQDGTLHVRVAGGGASLWLLPGGPVDDDEALAPADALIVGLSGHALTDERVASLVAAVRPRFVLPTHFDNIFHPLEKGIALLPLADLDGAREAFGRAAPEAPFVVLDFGETIRLAPPPPEAP